MKRILPIFVALFVVCVCPRVSGQWVTETYPMEEGWNAIWLTSNVSHDALDDLFPVSVEEIWRWNPAASTTQVTQSPNSVQSDTQWLVWKRGFPVDSTMTSLAANSAYLVKVANGTAAFNHSLTGKPVPPKYSWKGSGLNFLGFPMQTPADAADRNFETFLGYSDVLSAGPDLFKYTGSLTPEKILSPLFEPVVRGKAYWIRSSQYSDFYGPLRVTVARSGLNYGDSGSAIAFRLKNVSTTPLGATLVPVASATPPAGTAASAGAVPLRIRGALNLNTGGFDYTDFSGPTVYNLAADEEVEVVIAVDRAAMGGNAGDVFQSVLRITDSLNVSQVDLPVRAKTTSRSGLWIGAAVVTKVDQVTAAPAPSVGGTPLVGVFADASAPSEFTMRLIVHRADDGTVKLLQQVYIGDEPGGDLIIGTSESLLDASKLATARRLSSASFPLDSKMLNSGDDLGLSGSASFNAVLSHTAISNPFIHAYHPDHDNKDAQFNPVPLSEGIESYTVSRAINLNFLSDPASIGISDLGWGSTILGGDYQEVISGLRAQNITIKGNFVLRRISTIPTLSE